jgi:N-acetylglucosamine repressor
MTARIEPRLLGKMSERQVLRELQACGPLSRAEVARHSGLSAPAVSRAVAALLRSGLVEEIAEPHQTGGRPATRLRLARESGQVLGIEIDADRCRLVSASLDGQPHDEPRQIPTPATYAQLIEQLARTARTMMPRRTLGVGISLPGVIDTRSARGVLSPNVPITNGQAPAFDLSKKLDVECILIQESQALCLAEQHYGQARGLDDFAMLDIHTGVGLGVVSGGRPIVGHSGRAGEIGHIAVAADGRRCGCGNRGCLETVASDLSLAWRVSRKLSRSVCVEEVIDLARSGECDLSDELTDVCHFLAIGVAAVINLFNPSRLFIHGRLFDADNSLFARVVQQTEQRTLRPSFADCTIHRATGRKVHGAVAGIIYHLTSAIAPALESRLLRFPSEIYHALPAT